MITSLTNPRVKNLRRLRRSVALKRAGLSLIEGERELRCALAAPAWRLSELWVCRELLTGGGAALAETAPLAITEVSREVFAGIAVREDCGGLLGVAEAPPTGLGDLAPTAERPLIVLDGWEKPGNVGAALRTADAFGASGVVLLGETTYPYAPAVVRASLGAIFGLPVVATGYGGFTAFCGERNLPVIGADGRPEATPLAALAWPQGPCALAIGSEAHGLSAELRAQCHETAQIPMRGRVDSLNASVAAGILLYAWDRARCLPS